MATLVVLLRGINIGRNKRIAMADLRAMLEQAGYAGVRTVLQSGNVVLQTSSRAAAVEADIKRQVQERFNMHVDVMVRRASQIEAVAKADPFAGTADDGSRYFVFFLAGKPNAATIKQVRGADLGNEQFAVRGNELYAWCPDGLTDSPLIKALNERDLGVRATVRNWNTVTKLAALAAD